METYVININKAWDFAELFTLKPNAKYIININESLDLKDFNFLPINAETNEIVINGNGNTISNLVISHENFDYVGIFSKVKNLTIQGLNVNGFTVNGGQIVGLFAGDVIEEACVISSCICGELSAQSHLGSICGCTDNLIVSNSLIDVSEDAIDVVGGVTGICSKEEIINSDIKTNILCKGKTSGQISGYNSQKKESTINRMVLESLRYLPVELSEEEMVKCIRPNVNKID